MNLLEIFPKHWLIQVIVFGSVCIGTTWKIADQILVKPRDYTIAQLREQIKELQEQIGIHIDVNAFPPPKKIFLFKQLPKEGQIIIPKGFYFQIRINMQGNARKFKEGDTIDDIIKFSSEVAKDRANLYGKNMKDFPTVIWENSDEQYKKDILTLKEYPDNNTIKNITIPMVLYSNEHIIMFEYRID